MIAAPGLQSIETVRHVFSTSASDTLPKFGTPKQGRPERIARKRR
jgi:hypothetical protein